MSRTRPSLPLGDGPITRRSSHACAHRSALHVRFRRRETAAPEKRRLGRISWWRREPSRLMRSPVCASTLGSGSTDCLSGVADWPICWREASRPRWSLGRYRSREPACRSCEQSWRRAGERSRERLSQPRSLRFPSGDPCRLAALHTGTRTRRMPHAPPVTVSAVAGGVLCSLSIRHSVAHPSADQVKQNVSIRAGPSAARLNNRDMAGSVDQMKAYRASHPRNSRQLTRRPPRRTRCRTWRRPPGPGGCYPAAAPE